MDKTWKVKAHIEYNIDAVNEEEAVMRLGACILKDLGSHGDIEEIAQVNVEKIGDEPMSEDANLPYEENEGNEDEVLYDNLTSEPRSKYLNKSRGEHSVTNEIIKHVHGTLADARTGEEIIGFLQSAEPIFMNEVNRFVQIEVSRMKNQTSDIQTRDIGSIIGAAYIAGYLIARNAAHRTYDDLLNIGSPVEKVMAQAKHLVSKEKIAGKSVPEIMTGLFTEFIKESGNKNKKTQLKVKAKKGIKGSKTKKKKV